jgi:hypothetical protein
MNDWRFTLTKISEDLQIRWPVDPASATIGIEQFLSPCDRHHFASTVCTLPAWVAAAYDGLLREGEKHGKGLDSVFERLREDIGCADATIGAALDFELQTLRSELQMRTDEAATLRAEGQKMVQTLRELQMRTDEAATLRAERQKMAEEIAALHSQLEVTQAARTSSIAESSEKIVALEGRISALLNSNSWRMTKPLRVIGEFFKASRRRPR